MRAARAAAAAAAAAVAEKKEAAAEEAWRDEMPMNVLSCGASVTMVEDEGVAAAGPSEGTERDESAGEEPSMGGGAGGGGGELEGAINKGGKKKSKSKAKKANHGINIKSRDDRRAASKA